MTSQNSFRDILTALTVPGADDAHLRFRQARELFEQKDHLGAIERLERLLERPENDTAEVRELLARAYFHSAQLGKAETAARLLLQRDPTHGYAALLLTRTLQRAGRRDEAARAQRYAEALGVRV